MSGPSPREKDTVASRLLAHPNLREKLWTNVARALGSDIDEKVDKRFDATYARRQMKFFRMSDVPRPALPLDARILDIRMLVDITDLHSTAGDDHPTAIEAVFAKR